MQLHTFRTLSLIVLLTLVLFPGAVLRADENNTEADVAGAVLEESTDDISDATDAGVASAEVYTPTLALTLNQCIDRTLQENLRLEIQEINPHIERQNVRSAESVFDPNLGATINHKDADVPASGTLSGGRVGQPGESPTLGEVGAEYGGIENIPVDILSRSAFQNPGDPVLTSVETKTTMGSVGINHYLRTGTQYAVLLENARDKTTSTFAGFNPAYTWNLVTVVSQPLLQGWNAAQSRATIKIAENTRRSSEVFVTQTAMDLALETTIRYWELVFTKADLVIKKQSLALAQDLLRIKKAEVAAGVEAPIEIISASAGVAQREEDVIVAQNAIGNAEDNLRRIINVGTDPAAWLQPIEPADLPSFVVIQPDLEENIKVALEKEPLIEIARLDLNSREIALRAAQNRLLPSLNAVAGATLHGLHGSESRSFEELTGGDFVTWNIGLIFSYPLGNNAARSIHSSAQLRQTQSQLQLEDARQAVIQSVRLAVRNIDNSQKRIEAAIAARRLARERLDSIQKTFGVGLATTHDVLEFQDEYAQAQVREMRSVIDYIESLSTLERAKGTILESRGLTVD